MSITALRASAASICRRTARYYNSSSTTAGVGVERLPRFRVLFCGSDEFSVRNLEALLAATDVYQSVHVLTPRLRKTAIPLLDYASNRGLPTSQVPPEGISHYLLPEPFNSDPAASASEDDVLVTASFGHIIPNLFLSRFQSNKRLNVHPSLLPKYRGAAPIQWTVANGDDETGVSVQRLVERGRGIDGGDIVGAVDSISVPPNSTYRSLLDQVSSTGGDLLVDVLRKIQSGKDRGVPQDPALVTRAPKITHDTARIRWSEQTANEIDRLARGISHQYPLWTSLNGVSVQLFGPIVAQGQAHYTSEDQPGSARLDRKAGKLLVACARDSWIQVQRVKSQGKKEVEVNDWWNGLPKALREAKVIHFQ